MPGEELAAVPFVISGSTSVVVHGQSLVERLFDDQRANGLHASGVPQTGD
jgi:hypothetical protein